MLKRELYTSPEYTAFEPTRWHTSGISEIAGPYAYVLNLPEVADVCIGHLGCMDPGMLEEQKFTPAKVVKSLRADGLIDIPEWQVPQGGSHVIAVRFGENAKDNKPGLLLMRRDMDGAWSHNYDLRKKHCSDEGGPHKTDQSGAIISDPQTCAFAGYDQFLGFFVIPETGLNVVPRASTLDFHGGERPKYFPEFYQAELKNNHLPDDWEGDHPLSFGCTFDYSP